MASKKKSERSGKTPKKTSAAKKSEQKVKKPKAKITSKPKKTAKPKKTIVKAKKAIQQKSPVNKPVPPEKKPTKASKHEKAARPVISEKKSPPVINMPAMRQKPVSKLDSPRHVSRKLDARTRYSDKELEEFRQIILEKLDSAKKELKYLQDQINRIGDNGTDDTENKFASVDDGTSSMEREYIIQMAARQRLYIDHLDKALVRIQNKTYGICRVTGKLIEKERLRAVPHATLSMEAKMSQQPHSAIPATTQQ
jgi:RNA polymerase-binding transcription factor DksA